MELKLVDFDSNLWEEYRGAFGNVKQEIELLWRLDPILAEKERQWYVDMYKEPVSELRVAFDNLCEQLSHQLSFYSALYLVMPYLVKIYERWEKEAGFFMQGMLLSNIGIFLATDNLYNHTMEQDILKERDSNFSEIFSNYQYSIEVIQEKAKTFLFQYIDQLKQIDMEDRSMFATGIMGILGDREAAFLLTLGAWSQCVLYCPNCGELDEDIELDDYFGEGTIRENLQKKIKPANSVIGKWDGKSFDNPYLWFSNLLYLLGMKKEEKKIAYFYGTYTCPYCGETGTVMELAKLACIEG